MKYRGREIVACTDREDPSLIAINVMQKEGDCPRRYTEQDRYSCPFNCQNRFLISVYSIGEQRIISEVALNTQKWKFDEDNSIKHGFINRQISTNDFIRSILDDLKVHRDNDGVSLIYKDDLIAFRPSCKFYNMNPYVTPNPEVEEYQNIIRNFTRRIIENGGIDFHGPEGGLIKIKSGEDIRNLFK